MWFHSASDRSVGYLFLMRARVAKYPPRTTFHTASLGTRVNRGNKSKGRVLLRASSKRTILVSDRTLGHARALRGSLASAYASWCKEEGGAPTGPRDETVPDLAG